MYIGFYFFLSLFFFFFFFCVVLRLQIEMKEEDRLAAVVARIDEEVAIVPRGAYMKTPLGDVVLNKSFEGTYYIIQTYLNLFHVMVCVYTCTVCTYIIIVMSRV